MLPAVAEGGEAAGSQNGSGGGGPGPGPRVAVGREVFVQEAWALLLTRREASSPPAPLRASPKGCFSRHLLSKWHLDSALEALWGGPPSHPV